MNAGAVIAALARHANPSDAVFLQRFFKTGKGQYGEGDVFIGVRVPQTRAVCKEFKELPLIEVQKLFDSDMHEHRLAAAILLTYKYPKANAQDREDIYNLYLKNVRRGRVNNWDIVDTTAPSIVGRQLWDEKLPPGLLFEFAKSDSLWQRRVALLSSFYFIAKGEPSTSLELAELLLHDQQDLIQKAVGWMLREIGKRIDRKLLLDFLDRHAATMPRTALRYAIEHLPREDKVLYMNMKASDTRRV